MHVSAACRPLNKETCDDRILTLGMDKHCPGTLIKNLPFYYAENDERDEFVSLPVPWRYLFRIHDLWGTVTPPTNFYEYLFLFVSLQQSD